LPAGATATLLQQTAVTHLYRLETPTTFTLRLFQFDYLGWQAHLDDHLLPLTPESETGLILLDIPAGQHTLTVHFGETPLRVLSLGISGGTVMVLVGVAFWLKRRSVEEGNEELRRGYSAELSNQSNLSLSLILIFLIPLLAFGLKPLLRPLFTIHSPPDRVLPAQYASDIHFANGLRLTGYDVGQRVVAPGDYLPLVLYWETDTAPLRVNLQPFVHLDRLGDWTTLADATNYTPGDVTTESNMPTFHWDTARYVRDEHDLTIPADAPPLAYAVRVGLIDPDQGGQLWPLADGSGDTAQIAIINVAPREPPPALAHQLRASFNYQNETLTLLGFELGEIKADHLTFTLAWQSERPLQRDYTIFAQLWDSSDNLVTGFDQPPLVGTYPTSTWLPDQTILDPRTIPLDNVTPGEYRLIVGLYEATSQQRMVTATGTNFIELTRVIIEK
jgi:hypothetical protein